MLSIDVRMLSASGIGTYIKYLISRVIATLPSQTLALIGKPEELKELTIPKQARVTLIPCDAKIYSIREQLELPRLIPKETKLFWSPHYNIPMLYQGRMLVTIHDVLHLAMPSYLGAWHKRAYARLLFAQVRRKAEAILTDSQFSHDEILCYTPHGKQPITVVHLGIDDAWFNVPKLQKPYPRPYLLFVGNVKPHKNIRGLLEAFTLIHDHIPHDLIILGKREGFISGDEAVARQAEMLKERILFTGYVRDEVLKQYVTHADALVLPSFYEGFGLPPLEAMACGCPVIVSNAASLPEVCGDAALYCDPHSPKDIAEKIQHLVNDAELQERLRKKGLEQAKKFTWEKCAAETLVVIKKVLEQPNAR
jgi:glycosyltransferase involved in cell wall biosynthesis